MLSTPSKRTWHCCPPRCPNPPIPFERRPLPAIQNSPVEEAASTPWRLSKASVTTLLSSRAQLRSASSPNERASPHVCRSSQRKMIASSRPSCALPIKRVGASCRTLPSAPPLSLAVFPHAEMKKTATDRHIANFDIRMPAVYGERECSQVGHLRHAPVE